MKIKTKQQAIEFAKDRIEILTNNYIPATESEKQIHRETLEFLYFVKECFEKEV